MRTNPFFLTLAAAATLLLSSCGNKATTTEASATTTAADTSAAAPRSATAPGSATAARYTCPMHPEVVSDAPGKCPKCGMNLVKK